MTTHRSRHQKHDEILLSESNNIDRFMSCYVNKNHRHETGHTAAGYVSHAICRNPIDSSQDGSTRVFSRILVPSSLPSDQHSAPIKPGTVNRSRLRDNQDDDKKKNKEKEYLKHQHDDRDKNEKHYTIGSKRVATIIANLENEVDTLRHEIDSWRSSTTHQRNARQPPETSLQGNRNSTGICSPVPKIKPGSVKTPNGVANSTRKNNKRKARPMARNHVGKKVGRWSENEHRLFLQGLKLYGRRWIEVATIVKTRTDLQIRTHAQKYFLKLAKMIGIPVDELSDEAVEFMVIKDLGYDPKNARNKARNEDVDTLDTRADRNLNKYVSALRHGTNEAEEERYSLLPSFHPCQRAGFTKHPTPILPWSVLDIAVPSASNFNGPHEDINSSIYVQLPCSSAIDEDGKPYNVSTVPSSGSFLPINRNYHPPISWLERNNAAEKKNADALELLLQCDLLE